MYLQIAGVCYEEGDLSAEENSVIDSTAEEFRDTVDLLFDLAPILDELLDDFVPVLKPNTVTIPEEVVLRSVPQKKLAKDLEGMIYQASIPQGQGKYIGAEGMYRQALTRCRRIPQEQQTSKSTECFRRSIE